MQYIIVVVGFGSEVPRQATAAELSTAEAKAGFVPDSDIDSAGDRCADTDDSLQKVLTHRPSASSSLESSQWPCLC